LWPPGPPRRPPRPAGVPLGPLGVSPTSAAPCPPARPPVRAYPRRPPPGTSHTKLVKAHPGCTPSLLSAPGGQERAASPADTGQSPRCPPPPARGMPPGTQPGPGPKRAPGGDRDLCRCAPPPEVGGAGVPDPNRGGPRSASDEPGVPAPGAAPLRAPRFPPPPPCVVPHRGVPTTTAAGDLPSGRPPPGPPSVRRNCVGPGPVQGRGGVGGPSGWMKKNWESFLVCPGPRPPRFFGGHSASR